MSGAKAREEEYLRRMRERGYQDSLRGMDDEDIEEALARMDRGREEEPEEYQFNKTYRPPDRDFAERIFKMVARPFDPNWKMPDLDGPEFRQPDKQEPQGGARRPDWGGGENLLRQDGSQTMMYRPGRDNAFLPSRGTVERTLRYWPRGDNTGAVVQPMSTAAANPYAGGYADGGAYGDMLLPGATPQTANNDAGMTPSDKVVGFIANYERFEPKPYYPTPNDDLTIGYGHKIQPGEDFSNGISEPEARKMLIKRVQENADAINQWATANNLKLTQQQFDALVSLRYNLGSLEGVPKLRSLILSGNATPEQIREQFENTISDGAMRQKGLWQRRRDEADMYFNGDYRRKELPPPKELFPDS